MKKITSMLLHVSKILVSINKKKNRYAWRGKECVQHLTGNKWINLVCMMVNERSYKSNSMTLGTECSCQKKISVFEQIVLLCQDSEGH
jgi:hypothetical protein